MRGIIPTLWVCSAVLVAFPAWRPMPTYGSGKILTVQGLMPRRVSGGLDPELTIAAMRAGWHGHSAAWPGRQILLQPVWGRL